MLSQQFYIYSQSPVASLGLQSLLLSITNKKRITIVPPLSNQIKLPENEVVFHFVILSLDKFHFYSLAKEGMPNRENHKIVLCPMVNDLNFIPALKSIDFDALMAVEAITLNNLNMLIESVIKGNIYIDPFYLTEIVKAKYDRIESCFNNVSAREFEVIEKVQQDKTNSQIAEEMQLSIRTVNAHKRNLLKKFNAHSMEYVVDIVSRFGLVYNRFRSLDQ